MGKVDQVKHIICKENQICFCHFASKTKLYCWCFM